jgi:hypothetical protein
MIAPMPSPRRFPPPWTELFPDRPKAAPLGMQTIRLQKRENPLSVTADMNGLLSSNKTLAPQAGQSALGGDVLCIGDCSIAAVIFWNAIDRRSNIERRRFLAVELIACDHAQTFALRPPKPFGHRGSP